MWVPPRYAAHSSDDRELVAAVAEGFDLIVGEVLPFGEEAPQPGTYSGVAIPDLALDPRLGGGPLNIGVEQREKITEPVGTVGVEVVPAQLSIGDALVLRSVHATAIVHPSRPGGSICVALVGGLTVEVLAIALITLGLGAVVFLMFLEVGLSEERELAKEEKRRRQRSTDRDGDSASPLAAPARLRSAPLAWWKRPLLPLAQRLSARGRCLSCTRRDVGAPIVVLVGACDQSPLTRAAKQRFPLSGRWSAAPHG